MPISVILAMAITLMPFFQARDKNNISPFIAVNEPDIIHFNSSFFGWTKSSQSEGVEGGIEANWRTKDPKLPGNYYLYPRGSYAISLSPVESSDIRNLLKTMIDSSYCDDFILRHPPAGCYYEMDHGRIKRREYHQRYIKGDTIFVISGLVEKFLNFYMALPGSKRMSIDQLQNEVKTICPYYKKGLEQAFYQWGDENEYLVEYIDRQNMLRIRNMPFEEEYTDPESKCPITMKFRLIEITIFIDKTVMP